MLSYIHAYHAGNHADILKHLTISLILERLCKKEKPFCVIDTHAGSGIYNLNDERAIKTGESASGIRKLVRNEEKENRNCESGTDGLRPQMSTEVRRIGFTNKNLFNLCQSVKSVDSFFSLMQDFFSRSEYPGSPLIENAFLRFGDEQILSELHPQAFEELKKCFSARKRECAEHGQIFVEPQIHKRDGYELLKALTPPRIKRGLAVIDPSFEDASDFEKCADVILRIHRKWNTGIIALWYPLISHRAGEIAAMKEKIAFAVEKDKATEPKVLNIQMEVKRKEDMTGLSSLYGSGMLIVNFPYQLDVQMKEILPILSEILGESAHEWSVETVD